MAKKGKKKNRYGKRSRSGGDDGGGSLPDPDLGFSVNVIGGGESYTDILARSRQAVEDLKIEMDELTDAEAGVIRSTGEITNAHKSLFRTLTEGERMKGITEEAGKLGEALMDLGKEFLKTEEGEKMFAGLSEGAKTFGSTASSIAGGVVAGFATGGPVGAAIGGLTGLVKTLGGEWLEANKRIEESNAELARAEAEHYERMKERRREATNRAILQAYEAELDTIQDQTEALEEQKGVLASRQSLARKDFELQQTKKRLSGSTDTKLKADKIKFDLEEGQKEVLRTGDDAEQKRNLLERKRDAASSDLKAQKTKGLESDDYKNAALKLQDLEEQVRDALRGEQGLRRIGVNHLEGLQKDAERETLELDSESRDDLSRDAVGLRDSLKRRKKEGTLSSEGEGSLSQLNKILENGHVGRDELESLKTTLANVKNSRDAADRAVEDGLKGMAAATDASLNVMKALAQEMNRQRQVLESLKGKIAKTGDGR